jgi:hypothetical protein
VTDFPLPGSAEAVVAVPAPGEGPGYWAGAPAAVLDDDGSFVIGYRVREGHDGVDSTMVARSVDGETFETVATLRETDFDAMGMERPALVRTDSGSWRLYFCCATRDSKHWWVGVIEAGSPEAFSPADARPAFPGDQRTAVKDPIVRRGDGRWEAWICCHPLEEPGAADRMSSAYATSDDGLEWDWHGTVLGGRPGKWDARGARLTTILPDGRAAYDGRATAEENWFERTGLARRAYGGRFEAIGDEPVADVRYLEVVPLPDGGYRIFYEARLPDERHELRTERSSIRPSRTRVS